MIGLEKILSKSRDIGWYWKIAKTARKRITWIDIVNEEKGVGIMALEYHGGGTNTF